MSCKVPSCSDLTAALKEARAAAIASIGTDDGGSANLDIVILFIKPTKSMSIGLVMSSISMAGLHGVDHGKGKIGIHPPDHSWQGYNRTRQCEAMVVVLKRYGFDAYVKYVID